MSTFTQSDGKMTYSLAFIACACNVWLVAVPYRGRRHCDACDGDFVGSDRDAYLARHPDLDPGQV